MLINIKEIHDEGLEIETPLELGVLAAERGDSIRVISARLRGRALPGEQGVEFTGRLEARVELACGRCLEPFELPLATDFLLTLVEDVEEAEAPEPEQELEEQDTTLFAAPEGRAEVETIVREQIFLNLPLKPLCRADCRGLCPSCGANRNSLKCGCREASIDPRLAPLLELKRRES